VNCFVGVILLLVLGAIALRNSAWLANPPVPNLSPRWIEVTLKAKQDERLLAWQKRNSRQHGSPP